jgi:hypothetical protein
MEFATCTNDQLWDFVEGKAAARRGEPWNPHQTEWWQAGFLFWDERTATATTSPETTAQSAT